MQEAEVLDAQLRDKVWALAQRIVVLILFLLGGVLIGYRMWGEATQLQERVEELSERNQSLVKERDTERSKVTLVERDKKELQRRLDELQAKLAATAAEPAVAEPQGEPPVPEPQAEGAAGPS